MEPHAFSIGAYVAKRVLETDIEGVAAVQRLHERCASFVRLVTGAEPTGRDAATLLEERPPEVAPADKLVLSLQGPAGALIGVADLLRNYPEPRQWFVGLLLVDPTLRGSGAGSALWRGLERWMLADGANEAHLVVHEDNPAAQRFWERMGFVPGESIAHEEGGHQTRVRRMAKQLD